MAASFVQWSCLWMRPCLSHSHTVIQHTSTHYLRMAVTIRHERAARSIRPCLWMTHISEHILDIPLSIAQTMTEMCAAIWVWNKEGFVSVGFVLALCLCQGQKGSTTFPWFLVFVRVWVFVCMSGLLCWRQWWLSMTKGRKEGGEEGERKGGGKTKKEEDEGEKDEEGAVIFNNWTPPPQPNTHTFKTTSSVIFLLLQFIST